MEINCNLFLKTRKKIRTLVIPGLIKFFDKRRDVMDDLCNYFARLFKIVSNFWQVSRFVGNFVLHIYIYIYIYIYIERERFLFSPRTKLIVKNNFGTRDISNIVIAKSASDKISSYQMLETSCSWISRRFSGENFSSRRVKFI